MEIDKLHSGWNSRACSTPHTPIVLALLAAVFDRGFDGGFDGPATLDDRVRLVVPSAVPSAISSLRACVKKSFASRSPIFSMKYVLPRGIMNIAPVHRIILCS